MGQVNTIGEYINNQEWTEIVFKDSYARYRDLVSWGVEFLKGNDGEPYRSPHPLGAPSECIHWEPNFPQVLRKQVMASGAKIMDRLMVIDLLKHDKKIVGAIGISMDSNNMYVFKAKATVISAGGSGFKSFGWPIHELTGDGEAMAYRAGAEIVGKEFIDTHSTRDEYPGYRTFPQPESAYKVARSIPKIRWKIWNAEGDEVPLLSKGWPLSFELEFEAHAGRAPLFIKSLNGHRERVVGGAAAGLSVHSNAGIWPADTKCAAAGLQGLYAAGDSLGTMWLGAAYSGFGFATIFAAVTGARAGEGAAEYALQAEPPAVGDDEISRAKDAVLAPLERKGGFSPRWVTQVLQGITIPYFILRIKREDRLKAALTLVEFIRDHLVPKLKANDIHELRLCHETKNMVLNAEMRLRASLFRTESRGCHYREDYPRRRDPEWLAWVKLKQENGKMKVLWKEPIPKEWWPDLTKPYEERYPVRLPGE